jgi:3-oxoacyl-[acyl-carrier protein] reductase
MSIAINLSGKTTLITGASQGIGAEMARLFHRAGARVLINHPDLGDGKTRADAEQLAAELNATREESAAAVVADVSDAAAVEAMMHSVCETDDGIDILINNAAILRDRTIAKMTLDEWQSVIDVNLSGVFYCCKFGLEIMRDGGAIVNMASIAAIMGFYGQTNYAAAKAGVGAMTRVLSRECARRTIRVNAIAPGVVETSMSATIPQNVRDEMLKNIPLGRFGEPREIAEVALFLCSPLASYVTGQTIEVNGGWRG